MAGSVFDKEHLAGWVISRYLFLEAWALQLQREERDPGCSEDDTAEGKLLKLKVSEREDCTAILIPQGESRMLILATEEREGTKRSIIRITERQRCRSTASFRWKQTGGMPSIYHWSGSPLCSWFIKSPKLGFPVPQKARLTAGKLAPGLLAFFSLTPSLPTKLCKAFPGSSLGGAPMHKRQSLGLFFNIAF